jgi:hypothetical protein
MFSRSEFTTTHADGVLVLLIIVILLSFLVLCTCLMFYGTCFMCVRTYVCMYDVCMYVRMYV